MLAVLVQIDGFDPVTGSAVSLTAGSVDDPAVCHLGGATWWPALGKLPTLRYDLFDGAFAGQIVAPSSLLTLSTEPWPNFARYQLADARLRLWTGQVGDPWSGYTLRFDGRVSSQPSVKDVTASIDFAVDDRWLDKPLLTTFAGTGGAEGPAALKGQVKPLALGAPRYVSGTLVDSINSVFQVSGYGAVQGFEAALERLARFNAATGDFASYAALVAATVPAGAWATCNALGMARFGAPPAGQISFLAWGDKAGPDGWARKPGQLIRRLALLSGGAGRINDASLTALDVARPYNLSIYLDQQTTARDLIQKLAASVDAVAGVSWTGQLFVLPVAIGVPSVTLAADGSALPPVASVQQIAIDAPWTKLALTAERTWTVHALADIAFTAPLVDLGDYDAATVYREGNIVADQGTSWLWIATDAASGHAPPTLPTQVNTWWKQLGGGTGVQTYNDVAEPASPRIGDIWAPPGTGDLYRYTDGGTPVWVKISDITAVAQVAVTIAEEVVVAADSTGAVLAGQLPRTIAPQVTVGGADVRVSSRASYAVANVSANLAPGGTPVVTVNNTPGDGDRGALTIGTGITGSGSFDLVVTVDGVVQPARRVAVTRRNAAPAAGGGAGGGGGAGSTSGSADISGANAAGTTFVVAGTIAGLAVATGKTLTGTAAFDYGTFGSGAGTKVATLGAKWQYAPAGGSTWTDLGSVVTGSQATYTPSAHDGAPGSISCTQSVAPAAGSYDLRLVIQRASGTGSTVSAAAGSMIYASVS